MQSTGVTQLASGPGRRYIQRVLNGLLVGNWTKGTTGSVMAEIWFPGKRKSICPSSAPKKTPKQTDSGLRKALGFLQHCLSHSTHKMGQKYWYFAAWLLNCSFLHEQVSGLSSWAFSGSLRRGLVHFWELYQESSHLSWWGRTHLILH